MLSRMKSFFAMSSYKPAGPRLRFPSTGMKGSFGRVLLLLSLLILLLPVVRPASFPHLLQQRTRLPSLQVR